MTDSNIGSTGHKTSKGVGFIIHPSLVADRVTVFYKVNLPKEVD